MCDPTTPIVYKKPFYLFHYNRPKSPPLPKIKPIKYKESPSIPVRMNTTTKLRNKVIKEYSQREEHFVDYQTMAEQTGKNLTEEPEIEPRHNRTFQYRYKWIREVPVISCRFTEHVMTYKKPPFTFDRTTAGCGHYRLRTLKIHSPERETESVKEARSRVLMPSILI